MTTHLKAPVNTRPDPVPLHRLCVPDPQAVPIAVGDFDAIGPLSRADFPHRHTFYEVVFVTGGEGEHVIDFAGYPLCPPHIGFITPGQVHYWRDVAGLNGCVLLFTDAFLMGRPGDRDVWDELSERPWLSLDRSEAGGFATILSLMEQEHQRQEADFLSVLQAYLHVLLLRAGRVAGGEPATRSNDRATVVAARFSRMLARPGAADHSVGHYAARIGVSVGYLTKVVKTVTGSTPSQLIRQDKVLEARRLLGGTDLTVGQISRCLGFDDPAYFCRFFRRETGSTPGAFRRAVGRNHHDSPIESID